MNPVQKSHSSYKNITVYKKANSLSIDLIKYFSEKKYPYTYNFIVDQLIRSSCSVGANIVEGYGRYYSKSYRQFLSISRGSSFEVEYWLEIMLELTKDDILNDFVQRNNECKKLLTTMVKSLEEK